MEMNNFEEIDRIRDAWEQDIDSSVIKASTEDWEGYPPHVQTIIEAEARKRRLWEKVLYLRGEQANEPLSEERNLEGYVCEGCKGTYLNFETGRCRRCDLPPEDFGYCKTCDQFFSIPPRKLCPKNGTKLVRHKAAMALRRIGNDIFDMLIFRIILFPTVFLIAYSLVLFGLVEPESFAEIDPLIDWILTVSLFILYYFIFESIWQRTPAKFITGTKVIACDGTKPTTSAIAIRTLVRFVPFEAFSFLGERVRGWHDRWSGTYVIKAKRFERKTVDQHTAGDQLKGIIVTQLQQASVIKTYDNSIGNLSVPHKRVEVCENCENSIGKLEQQFMFKSHVICAKCHKKLNESQEDNTL